MSHPLWAHHLKLRRAYEHLHDLEKNINVFIAEQGGKLREYFEDRSDGWWYVVGTDAVSPTPYWGVIVGDFAHNLRSLLDQLVWTLVTVNQEEPGRHNAFPVCENWDAWDATVENPTKRPSPLQGVSVEARAEIQWLQPYHSGNEPLGLLSWLSNTDKHQLVHPSSIASSDGSPIGLMKRPDGSVEELRDVVFHSDVPLDSGPETIVEVRLPETFTLERADYVSIDRFPVDVAFGDKRLRYRDLKEIYEFTSRLLGHFDTLI